MSCVTQASRLLQTVACGSDLKCQLICNKPGLHRLKEITVAVLFSFIGKDIKEKDVVNSRDPRVSIYKRLMMRSFVRFPLGPLLETKFSQLVIVFLF